MKRCLIKGNEAIVYGALLGGATHFFGYPITPASEIAHAAAVLFPKLGRCFLQMESEVSSINALYGAAAAGARVMTASSGPGIALMGEGLSYLAGAELPSVVVDIQRAGPGLGNIWPEQGDYNMVVKGGGHGNYRNIVLAPFSAQEMFDMAFKAFELADRYRMTVIILSDAFIGQIMEPVTLPAIVARGLRKEWALYADRESRHNLITSIFMNIAIQSAHNEKLQLKYNRLHQELAEYEMLDTNDAEYLLVAFGISARICHTAVRLLREQGISAGLLRPKTLFPFPRDILLSLSSQLKKIFVVELNNGQMADDVELAVKRSIPVLRYSWMGGMVPSTQEVVEKVKKDI